MKFLTNRHIIVFIVLLCVFSRLPQLFSPNLLLDGDECVVATMARHMLTGKDFSLFFYGQSYGFSLIECLFILPFFAIFGISAICVKLAMLALWTTGVVFLYKALDNILSNKRTALILITLFILLPTWAVWSMKARGGYLTSFACCNIVLYLLFKKAPKDRLNYLLIGLLLVIIYQSQPLWLAGLIPLLLLNIIESNKRLLFMAATFAPLMALFLLYKKSLSTFYTPTHYVSFLDSLKNIPRIPELLYYSLHGNYFFDQVWQPNIAAAVNAWLVISLVFVIICAALYNIIKHRKLDLLSYAALSLILILSYTIICEKREPRYLLPFTGFMLIALAILLANSPHLHRFFYPFTFIIIASGAAALYMFKDYRFCKTNELALKHTLQYLQEKDVHYAYCNDNLLTWQINFYSDEKLLCHERFLPGRYPQYTHAVDSAYYAGAPTALIGYEGEYYDMDIKPSLTLNGFFIMYDPPKDLLLKNFRLW